MSAIGFVMEKVRHGSGLDSGELKLLSDEIDRLMSKIEALAQELARREEADTAARQADRERVEHLRRVEVDVTRLRGALEHERQRREVQLADRDKRITEMEGLLKDINYGLLYQPELTREELASAIATEVTPHAKPGK